MNTKLLLFLFAWSVAAGNLATVQAATNSKGFGVPQFRAYNEWDNDSRLRAKNPPIGFKQTGKASFYGGYWNGRRTANGEIYNQMSLTAAHKSLPFNSQVLVRNLLNNKETVVRINNRGPFVKGRIIDLSVAAANRLEMRGSGVVPVEIQVIR